MNLLLLTLSLVYTLGHVVDAAPAVTSVHVSFVSGNKKTQYSHGTSTGPAVVQYNLVAAGTDTGDPLHLLRRRSISKRPQLQSGQEGDVPRTRERRRYRGGQVPTSGTTLLVSPTDSNGLLSSSSTIMTSENPTPTSTRSASGLTTSKTKRRYRGPSPLTFRTTTTGYVTNNPANSITTSHTSTKLHKQPSTFSKTSSTLSTPTTTKKTAYTGTSEDTASSGTTTTRFPLRRLRSRVRFTGTASTTAASSLSSSSSPGGGDVMAASAATAESAIASTAGSLLDDMSSTVDLKKAEKNPKDTKAVKRSPYIENFESRGITFPDFDEFGGNEFGALRNFIGGSGGGGGGGGGSASVASHRHANPESLSPDGVFLPPLPTEASDYAEDSPGHSDPYLADAETAKYAAQHPPFFAAFPHKRTVLDLNERRVEQGLEPNILRSIRPYFAFFEAANHHHRHQPFPSPQHVQAHYHQLLLHDPYLDNSGKGVYVNDHHEQHHFPSLIGHSPSSPSLPVSTSNTHIGSDGVDNYLFNTVDDHHHDDPNVLLYTQSIINNQAVSDVAEAWRAFPHKRRRK